MGGEMRKVRRHRRKQFAKIIVHDFEPGLNQLSSQVGPLTAILAKCAESGRADSKLEWFEDRLYPILHLKYFGELLETDPCGGIWKKHAGCKGRRVSSARLHRVAMGIMKVLAREGL